MLAEGGNQVECPICGAELVWEDQYGYFCAHQSGEKLGDIFRCPNGVAQDGTCESECFSVAGSLYTTKSGELREGYPC